MTAWDDQGIGLTTLVVGGNGLQLLLCENVADPEKRGCTLIRTIIGLSFLANSPGSVTGRVVVTFAIALASDDAFSAGALPDPEVDDDFPIGGWLYRTRFPVMDGVGEPVPTVHRIDADIRAGRKLDRSTIYMDMHSSSEFGSSFTVAINGMVRCLYKLP